MSPHKTFWILTLFFNLNINQIERMKFLFYLQNASKDTIIQLQNVSLGKYKMFKCLFLKCLEIWANKSKKKRKITAKILKKTIEERERERKRDISKEKSKYVFI